MGRTPGRRLRPPRRIAVLPGATTVHLVRHATHGLLPHTLAGRRPGVPLSSEGQAEAARLADRFRGEPVAAIVSSPVQRARETAAPIAAALDLPVTIDPAWEEIDFGRWTGLRFEALDADPAWHTWNRLRSLAACPGGETMHAAQSRALQALSRLRTVHAEATILVVSHADILKSVLAAVLGLSLDNLQRFSLAPASVSTLRLFDDTATVDTVNT